MTDVNAASDDLIINKLIDDVVARRPASAPDLSGAYDDRDLVHALAQLSPAQWPDDQAPARPPLRHGRRRPRRATVVAAIATAAAAALLIAGAVQLPTGPSRPVAGHGTRPGPAVTPSAPAQRTVAVMAIVSQPGALRAVGVIGSDNDFLFCSTRLICYIQGYRDRVHAEVARTLNGGVTWKKGTSLPAILPSWEWDAQMSCPKALTCFSGYGSDLLVTTDGFAHVSILPVASAGEQLGDVSCPTTRHCVAVLEHGRTGLGFVSTTDGGATWATASSPPIAGADNVGDLTCDRHGACIALLLGGDSRTAKVSALSSADGGRTWSAAPPFASIGDQEEWRFDCGDARNCVVTGNNGNLAWIHVSRAGHIAIRVQPYPKSWPQGGDDVSCATGRDCFIEVSPVAGQFYINDTIEVTRDGGRTWAGVIKTPIASTFLSCPVPAGCVAVAPKNPYNLVVLSNLLGGR